MYRKRSIQLLHIIVVLFLIIPILSACLERKISSDREAVTQIACGDGFTLFLYNTGKVCSIGKNTVGQLGVGDRTDRDALTEVLLSEKAIYIEASDDCAYALTEEGNLYAWGDNRYKQAGDTPDWVVTVPTRIPIEEKVKLGALGWAGSFAWTESGNLYGWGRKGILLTYDYTTNNPNYESKPLVQKGVPTNQNIDIINLAAGSTSLLGIAKDGTVFGQTSDTFKFSYPSGKIIKVGAGRFFYVMLTKEGSLYLWGQNTNGELGCGDYSVQEEPQLLDFSSDPIQDISVGPNHILAVGKSGTLWAWGDNSNYQLGLDVQKDILTPTAVSISEKITAVATGFTHSYAVGRSGQLYAFGSNQYGQLYTGSQDAQKTPMPISLNTPITKIEQANEPQLEEETIVEVLGTKFLTESGKVFTFGYASNAKVGMGNIDDIFYPPVNMPFREKIIQMDEDIFGITALGADGIVYNWGYNESNVLGREFNKSYLSPTLLNLEEKIVKIHSGTNSTAAMSGNGSWYMWGDNEYGGLAIGDMLPVTEPVKIFTPIDFIDISPGMAHSLALTAEGDVYLWGSYKTKIEGYDTLVRDITPADLKYKKVQLPEAILKIEVGNRSCYALSATGNLYVWGESEVGELGIGDKKIQETPIVLLTGVKDFSVSPDGYSVLATTEKGEVFAWGNLGYDINELKTIYSYTPKKISFPEKINKVVAGDYVFYAAGQSSLYTWGTNYMEKYGREIMEPVPVSYHYGERQRE